MAVSDDDHIRNWWRSLPPDAQAKFREVVKGDAIEIDEEALEKNIAEAGDYRDPVKEKLAQLNADIEGAAVAVGKATMSYFELDYVVREFVEDDNHPLEQLTDVLWRPLGTPRADTSRLANKVRILAGLLEELDLALDPDPHPSLEEQLELARMMDDRGRIGVLTEALRVRVRYLREFSAEPK